MHIGTSKQKKSEKEKKRSENEKTKGRRTKWTHHAIVQPMFNIMYTHIRSDTKSVDDKKEQTLSYRNDDDDDEKETI